MRRFLFMIFVFLGCAAHTPYAYPAPQNKQDCMQLFSDVLDIQQARNRKMHKMAMARDLFQRGAITEKKYHKIRTVWLKEERHLQTHVTHIYDVGYEYGCFAKE